MIFLYVSKACDTQISKFHLALGTQKIHFCHSLKHIMALKDDISIGPSLTHSLDDYIPEDVMNSKHIRTSGYPQH